MIITDEDRVAAEARMKAELKNGAGVNNVR